MKRALVLLLLISACSASQPAGSPNALLATATSYQAALTVAVAYNKRPRCGDGAPVVCSDPVVVARLRQMNQIASASLHAWEDAVFSNATNAPQKQVEAQAAIANFKTAAEATK